MKKLNGGTRRRVTRRKNRAPKPQRSKAIVQVTPETPTPGLQRLQSEQFMQVIPSIKETIQRLEAVRRFVVSGLNQGLKRAEAKAKRAGKLLLLSDAERRKLEIDYGTIPGVDKPFLKQPGAEKIALWLHVRPKYATSHLAMPDGHLETLSRCHLISVATQDEVFQGPECSCSSMETNFRYRFVEADPQPSREVARKAMFEGKGKWKYVHVLEKGRVVFLDGKPVLERKWHDRLENSNIHDERNKVRQQAEKRALVKAIRNFGALSEIFVEDPSEWELDPELAPERTANVTQVGKIVRDPDPVPKSEQPAVVPDAVPDGTGKTVQLVFLSEAGEAAHVSGDIGEIVSFIKKECHGIKLPDADVYQIPGAYVEHLAAKCREWKFTFQEVSRRRRDSKPGCGLVVMTKVSYKPGTKNVAYFQVLIKDDNTAGWYFCYNPQLYSILAGAVDKDVELIVNAKVIVGLKRIDTREYDEDGITPVIQVGENRQSVA